MATQSSVNVTASGSSPIATYQQTQNATTVQVQQFSAVDPTSGQGATVDLNGLHVVPSVGTPNTSGALTATGIVSGGSATLTSSVPVTNAKTGTLQHGIFSSTQPVQWTLQTINNAGTPTTVANFITDANRTYDFKPGSLAEIATVLSTGTAAFQVVANNLSTNQSITATAYATFFWAEN